MRGIAPDRPMAAGVANREYAFCRHTIPAFPWVAPRIESTCPPPWVFIEPNANAFCDGSYPHVAIVDVPALVRGIRITASGSGGKPLWIGAGRSGAHYGAVWRMSWTTVCAAYRRRADGPPDASPRARQYSRFASAGEGAATTWCWLADTGARALVAR
jgi:hypothetical protein